MNTKRIISIVELKTLLYLSNHPKKINAISIARNIDIVYNNLSNKIKSMEDKGLIERIKNIEDKRGYDISLTPKGIEVVALILKIKRLCSK